MADADLLRDLNRDVWHEFRRAYGARDADAFLALYTPDLIHAGGPTKQVHGVAEFAAQTRQWFAELAERGIGIAIEFRFLERLASGDAASERGIFQITATPPDGGERTVHGTFHTFSRKVDGRWRIAVDYDSDEGGSVTGETFQAAAGVDDVATVAGR